MNFKPRLPKIWLHIVAGTMWIWVGLYLISLTVDWISPEINLISFLIIFAGIILASAIYFFGFSKVAIKNIKRIDLIVSERPCIFAFQEWKSYPLVAVMISMGIYLRKYSLFPKSLLAIMYIGIGGGLFLSGFKYFQKIIQIRNEKPLF
ncbi:MAG: hypothetical protein HON98_03065 [Chloroflexi bacterium]|jgi:hypothetical protein|nr:hypothetical protein [Chloroflexota bacterium]MBT3670337.1 hypothetical protein [Chloroflexota bacterium]MBT4002599.1 hypothetical protein [Chloroflexota bacterium]MBT4305524.1 hypothetical protein [Chloroflexota bacterium]MBT4533136.1 hypothetical protein [Chloroflexota bacterium]